MYVVIYVYKDTTVYSHLCMQYIFALLFRSKAARMTLLMDLFSENARRTFTELTNVKLMML